MTLRELSIYYKLHERLERNRQMLSSLYATAGLGAQEITGMPHAPGVSDQVSSLLIEIEDLKERISHLESECAQEKKILERYIATIEDDQTRMVFRLRFVHCMTWPQVAKAIGGRNTANSVKLICHRYLNPKS
jgi:site-specific recombinase XerD